MKKQWMLPALALVSGAAAFALRLWQNATGFEEETGLAVPGVFAGTALPLLLVLTGAAALILGRRLPKRVKSPAFAALFSIGETTDLLLPVMGAFLMAISGAADAATGLGVLPGACFAPAAHLLLGLLTVVSAGGFLLAASACRHRQEIFQGALVLPAAVMLVVRLVLVYRAFSTDPTLEGYYVELLALVFLAMAFFHLAGFAFDDARPRRFAASTVMAAVFSMAALADRGSIPALALYAGGSLTLLGFLAVYDTRTDM